ncbi:PQQ-binding-like beta-propeller repeat protein [Candidatus Poribacteria bacterium]|nr:PQQ-binding-like beta-propeller repeat protein [Candidatus Poribacteria bacterium]
MKKTTFLTIFVCVLAIFALYTLQTIADQHASKSEQNLNFENNWPHWRGPHATGAAVNANPPTTWSETENIRWKVRIPGMGHATPIVWEDRIFIQTAIKGEMPKTQTQNTEAENPPEDSRRRRRGRRRNEVFPSYKFDLIALNRSDGSVLWQKTLRETPPHEGIHETASFASNSPITDGEHIYAYFGSRGLYCLDMAGNLKWEKDIGKMQKRNTFGEGSCPIIHGNTIVILQDHEGPSFITALDKRTGDELWKMDRDERTTWTSPIVVEHGGKAQVIVTATNRSRSYDLETGEVLWECGGMTGNVIPTPVAADGLVYLISGFRGAALQAVNIANAVGDITGSTEAIAWEYNEDTPYVPSPLLHGNILYFLKGNDIISAVDKISGELLYGPIRIGGVRGIYASIVGAADRVYVVSRNGTVAVVQHGPKFEILAQNYLEDSFNASPAIVGSELYLRGSQYLYCIAE